MAVVRFWRNVFLRKEVRYNRRWDLFVRKVVEGWKEGRDRRNK